MPHLRTAVFGGTPKIFHPFGSVPFVPASSTASLCSSLSLSSRGPARSFCLSSNRYQVVFVFSLTRACCPARSEYNESFAIGKPCALIEGATRLDSKSKSSSCAVLPRISITCSGFLMPGRSITIWSLPCLRISGSATPSRSTRSRRISTERSRSDSCSGRLGGGTAFSVTSRPPWRSSPRVGVWWIGDPGMASSPTPMSPAAISATRVRCGLRFTEAAE